MKQTGTNSLPNDASPEPGLAYADPAFLASDDARPLRIIAEYLGPLQRFHRAQDRKSVV